MEFIETKNVPMPKRALFAGNIYRGVNPMYRFVGAIHELPLHIPIPLHIRLWNCKHGYGYHQSHG
jgi:hypothetical protein